MDTITKNQLAAFQEMVNAAHGLAISFEAISRRLHRGADVLEKAMASWRKEHGVPVPEKENEE